MTAAAKVAIYGTLAAGGSRCERAVPVSVSSAAADLRAKDNAAMVFQQLLEIELNKLLLLGVVRHHGSNIEHVAPGCWNRRWIRWQRHIKQLQSQRKRVDRGAGRRLGATIGDRMRSHRNCSGGNPLQVKWCARSIQ